MQTNLVLLVAVASLIATLALLGGFSFRQHKRSISLAREQAIRSLVFPGSVMREVIKLHPHLELKDVQLVGRALRQFFLVHARAPKNVIAMPSKVVDALWHAFILDTRAYQAFCRAAFGSYFHHLPETVMGAQNKDGVAIWCTWYLACLEENINPAEPTRLPLLFAIGTKLSIPDAIPYDIAFFKRSDGSGGCGGAGYSCSGNACSDGGGGGGCGGGCGGGGGD